MKTREEEEETINRYNTVTEQENIKERKNIKKNG